MAVIKKVTIQELIHRGFPIVPGSKFVPKEWITKRIPSLQEIHRRLSKIKGDLASEISRMRDEEG